MDDKIDNPTDCYRMLDSEEVGHLVLVHTDDFTAIVNLATGSAHLLPDVYEES